MINYLSQRCETSEYSNCAQVFHSNIKLFPFMVYSLVWPSPPNCNSSRGWLNRSPLLGWVVLFGIDPLRRILPDLSAKRGRSLTGRCWDHSNSLFGEFLRPEGKVRACGPDRNCHQIGLRVTCNLPPAAQSKLWASSRASSWRQCVSLGQSTFWKACTLWNICMYLCA